MSLTKRELDREVQAEQLSRGAVDPYYGEEWPSDEELMRDSQREKDEQRLDTD